MVYDISPDDLLGIPKWADYLINLLAAARKAGVKSFAPYRFEVGPLLNAMMDVTTPKCPVWNAYETSGLKCIPFCCGTFMNHVALGSDKSELLWNLVDVSIICDVKHHRAELPQWNDSCYPKITLIELSDIGRLVMRACELVVLSVMGDSFSI